LTECQNCQAASPAASLCDDCRDALKDALDQIPWQMLEVETTICRLDRLNLGVVGKSSENPSPINLGAAAVSSEMESLLIELVDKVSETYKVRFFPPNSVGHRFIGPLLPGWRRLPRGFSGSPVQRANWLSHHVNLVAKLPTAGQFYRRIVDLVGDPDKPSKPGRLIRAIDRSVRCWAGTCPTAVGRDREGLVVMCGRDLWAEDSEAEITCAACQQEVNVKRNRERMVMDRDLLPEKRLMEVMETLGERIYSDKIQKWLKSGRLKPSGYLAGNRIVEHRVDARSARLFSLSRCRQLNWQDTYSAVAS
jgi:hypothetical protein